MIDPATLLHWSTLTGAIRNVRPPNSFILNRFFNRRSRNIHTRTFELSYISRGRKIAPFVKRDGEAIFATGKTSSAQTVSLPHIRLKKAMSPSDVMHQRQAGTAIYPTPADQDAAIRNYIADEQMFLMDDVANTMEWMCAQSLQGAISYTGFGQESFTVTIPRAAGHTIVLSGTDEWSHASSNPYQTIMEANQIVNDAEGMQITDIVMSPEAADAYSNNAKVLSLADNRRVNANGLDLTQRFREDGALYLGQNYMGIDLWRYDRSVEMPDGSSAKMIRPGYVEMIANTPTNEFEIVYGAIEDWAALGEGNILVAPRFMKSWTQEDPSVRMLLLESNPLPVMRRPNATLSMRVVTP